MKDLDSKHQELSPITQDMECHQWTAASPNEHHIFGIGLQQDGRGALSFTASGPSLASCRVPRDWDLVCRPSTMPCFSASDDACCSGLLSAVLPWFLVSKGGCWVLCCLGPRGWPSDQGDWPPGCDKCPVAVLAATVWSEGLAPVLLVRAELRVTGDLSCSTLDMSESGVLGLWAIHACDSTAYMLCVAVLWHS